MEMFQPSAFQSALEDPRKTLLVWIRSISQNRDLDGQKRMKALYILSSFEQHGNVWRLMAQSLALARGELSAPHSISHILGSYSGPGTLVYRCSPTIENIINNFDVNPDMGDFQCQPVELFNVIPLSFEEDLDGETRFKMHLKVLEYEALATSRLVEYAKRYGYHYIFRAGLRQYYLTKLVCDFHSFIRKDVRGEAFQKFAQAVILDALNDKPNLNQEELQTLVDNANAYPYDILRTRNWIVSGRPAYYAMKACIRVMDIVAGA
ncbi:hypothetical protein VTN31DRAFT_5273 [Thermomyces dupontii]|uniref:uncharacterized protein n=1 Tax=Talaromyces thermophilus TaxID=28565 RepID=UPI00374334E8